MIFKRPVKLQKANSCQRPKSWKSRFKANLYSINYSTNLIQNTIQISHPFNQAAKALVFALRKCSSSTILENQLENSIDLLYCSYIPLKKSIELDDEIINTFPYVRMLEQCNNYSDKDMFYTEIRKFLSQCKSFHRVEEGWETCKKRFIAPMDIIQRIQAFCNCLKYGTHSLEKLKEKHAKTCLMDVLAQRVLSVKKYFQKEQRINRTFKVSLQIKDVINEANISKTMKMLFCSICLIYDCGKHQLQDLTHSKDYHYCSLKSRTSTKYHISMGIKLLRQIQGGQGIYSKIRSQVQICSEGCFRKINPQNYDRLQSLKYRIISPMFESMIKIGIEVFSYDPCSIASLFPQKYQHCTISCSVICLYLVEQINISLCINHKLFRNEQSYLLREESKQSPPENLTNLQSVMKRKKRKSTDEFKYQKVAICFHGFVGQQSFDIQCEQCACVKRGFCLPECHCGQNCSIPLGGCVCKSKQECQSIKCACYKSKTQCIPGVCQNCFPTFCSSKKNNCNNEQILRNSGKSGRSIKIGFSKIQNAGLGAFAAERIKKGSLISVYCGEIINQEMGSIRETLKKGESFYNFACSEGTIDARFLGNVSRFINHGNEIQGKTNLVSLNMYSSGQQQIGLYALRDIEEGEQLLFDYDGEGQIAKTYSGIYSFLKKQRLQD